MTPIHRTAAASAASCRRVAHAPSFRLGTRASLAHARRAAPLCFNGNCRQSAPKEDAWTAGPRSRWSSLSAACFGTLGILTRFVYARGRRAARAAHVAVRRGLAADGGVPARRATDARSPSRAGTSAGSRCSRSRATAPRRCATSSRCRSSGCRSRPCCSTRIPPSSTLIGLAFLGERRSRGGASAAIAADVRRVRARGAGLRGAGRGESAGHRRSASARAWATRSSTCSRHRFMSRRPRVVLMAYTFGISAVAIGIVGAAHAAEPVRGVVDSRGVGPAARHRARADVRGRRALPRGDPQAGRRARPRSSRRSSRCSRSRCPRCSSASGWRRCSGSGAGVVLAGVVLSEWGTTGARGDEAASV